MKKLRSWALWFITLPPFILAAFVENHYDIKGAATWWFGGIICLASALGAIGAAFSED